MKFYLEKAFFRKHTGHKEKNTLLDSWVGFIHGQPLLWFLSNFTSKEGCLMHVTDCYMIQTWNNMFHPVKNLSLLQSVTLVPLKLVWRSSPKFWRGPGTGTRGKKQREDARVWAEINTIGLWNNWCMCVYCFLLLFFSPSLSLSLSLSKKWLTLTQNCFWLIGLCVDDYTLVWDQKLNCRRCGDLELIAKGQQ